jgi:uroporphyrinogen-III synthase
MSLSGIRVIAFESRRAAELASLIRRWEGEAFIAPSVKEKAIEENPELFRWAERLFAGEFDMVVLMTGAGLGYLRDAVQARYSKEEFAEALRRTTIVSRGPKPLAVLRELDLKAQVVVPEPNTWREIVPIVAARPERRITIQEYGRSNPEFVAALKELGASADTISIYRWELPDDMEPLRQAAARIADRDCDVVIFTTSVQLCHLLQVAAAAGLEHSVRKALAEDLVIASVGPIMNAALAEEGIEPDIVPVHPKMGHLVRVTAEQARDVLARKRSTLAGT